MKTDGYVVRRSLFISFMERYSITALQFVSVMVLARILTPEEIGIYSVGLAFINLAHIFRDFGVGRYLIQEKDLTKEKVAAAWGITFALAWILGALSILMAPWLAEFYDTKSVEMVVYVASISFFLMPLGAMAKDILKRSMSFGTLFKINVASTLANVIVGITLALSGFSFMSMAWASVASVFVAGLMAQLYLPEKFRTIPSFRNCKPVLKFGSHVVGAEGAREISASLTSMLIGKYLGFASLGMFSRGEGYTKMYNKTISRAANRVIHSQFSKEYRRGGDLAESFESVVDYLTLIGWVSIGYMAAMSLHLIRLLYGDQWDEAATYASIICLSLCISIITQQGRRLFDATGEVAINFWIALVFAILKVIGVIVLMGFGLEAICYGFLSLAILQFFCVVMILNHKGRLRLKNIITVIVRNLTIAIVSLIAPIIFWLKRDELQGVGFIELVLSGAYTIVVVSLLVFIMNHPVRSELQKLISWGLEKLKVVRGRY